MGDSYEVLSFGEAFDWYTRVIYDAEAVAAGVASVLRRVGAHRVLDCAAGTGLPALQLHQLYGGRADGRLELDSGPAGKHLVELVCSDGSQAMVDQFHRNAKSLGLDVGCDLVDWADLRVDPIHDDGFDVVLCRGNSLVYALSWDGGSVVPDRGGLVGYLDRFASVLRPGGLLQIDAPRHLRLPAEIKQAVRTYEYTDAAVEVVEKVTETATSRHWECTVSVEPPDGWPKRLSFDLHSAKMTIDDVHDLLEANRFEIVDRFQVPGDRHGHETILAKLVDQR